MTYFARRPAQGRRRVAWLVAALCAGLMALGVRDAIAQDQATATLEIVAEVEGEPEAVAAVEVAAADGALFSARTGRAGTRMPADVRLLPAGRYRVSVSSDGRGPAALDVVVVSGEIVWLRASLRRSGQPPGSSLVVLDRWHAGDAVVITEPLLGGLPASGHVWSLIDALVPWTVVDGIDHGGSETGRRGWFGGRDGSVLWNSFVVDGVDLTDPDRPSGPLSFLDPKALQAMTVTSGQAPAAVASPGAQVTFVPRRPGAAPHGSVEFSGTSSGMTAPRQNVVAPFITQIDTFADVNGQVSGPIGDRAGAYVAVRRTQARVYDRGQPEPRVARATSLFGHVVARTSASNELRIVAAAARTLRPLEGGDAFLGRRVDERDTFGHGQVRWDRAGRSGLVGSVAAGVARGVFAPDLADPVGGGVVDRVTDGAMPSPAARRTSRRTDVSASLALPIRALAGSRHAVRVEASFTAARSTTAILAAPDVAERVAGIPARIWHFEAPPGPAVRRLTHVAWAVADDVRLGDYAALDAGVRVDHWNGRADGAPAGITTTTYAPRLALRATVPSHVVAVYGAVGRYHPRLPLEWLAFGDTNQPWARLYRWTDPNSNGRVDPGEQGPQLALAGWGAPIGAIDPALRLPATTEVVFGGEVRVRTATLSATATIRHQTSLVRAVNVGIPVSAYTRTLIPDQTDDGLLIPVYNRPPDRAGDDRNLLTNPALDPFKAHMLEIAYDHRFTPRFSTRASALAFRIVGPTAAPGFRITENDQGVLGEWFQDPNTLSHSSGRTFFDRAYVLKWNASYLAPKDVWIAFTANYRDGQPFAGFLVQPDLVQGPEVLQSYKRGRTRFTFTLLLDARLEKRFAVGRGQAAVWLDVFNAPNLYEEVEENPVQGPGFRASTALQPPLTLRAGVRFGF